MTKGGWRSSIALKFGVAGKERRVNLRGVYGQGQGEGARGVWGRWRRLDAVDCGRVEYIRQNRLMSMCMHYEMSMMNVQGQGEEIERGRRPFYSMSSEVWVFATINNNEKKCPPGRVLPSFGQREESGRKTLFSWECSHLFLPLSLLSSQSISSNSSTCLYRQSNQEKEMAHPLLPIE